MQLFSVFLVVSASVSQQCRLSGVHITLGEGFDPSVQHPSSIIYRVGAAIDSEECVPLVKLHLSTPQRLNLPLPVSFTKAYMSPDLKYSRVYLFFDIRDLPDPTRFTYSLSINDKLSKGPFDFNSKLISKDLPTIAVFGEHSLSKGQALLSLLKRSSIDALFLMGGIAYDPQDKEGIRGDEYFDALEPVVARVPLVFVPGCREGFDQGKLVRSRFTFIGERESTENITTPQHLNASTPQPLSNGYNNFFIFRTEWAGFIAIDYEAILSQGSEFPSILSDMEAKLKTLKKNIDYPIVVLSHRSLYRADLKDHKEESLGLILRLKPFEDLLAKYGARLFLAGHGGTYERYVSMFGYSMMKEQNDAIVVSGNGGIEKREQGRGVQPLRGCGVEGSLSSTSSIMKKQYMQEERGVEGSLSSPEKQPYIQYQLLDTPGMVMLKLYHEKLNIVFVEANGGDVMDTYDVFSIQASTTAGFVIIGIFGGLSLALLAVYVGLLAPARKRRVINLNESIL